MTKAKKIPGVPEQYKGAYHDTESDRYFDNTNLLNQQFEFLKNRFCNINHWKDYCGKMSADYKLFDHNGSFIDRAPVEGDFMRIDIPGPGDPEAKGFDWVEIVKVDNRCYGDELERYLISCRPSKSPDTRNSHIVHFYSEESTSTLVISRGKNYIKIGIYGRNEVANFSKTGFLGKIRNFLISLGGFTKATKLQWKSLADGLLDFE